MERKKLAKHEQSRLEHYEGQLAIDKDNLDDVVIANVLLYNEVGRELELSVSRRDQMKFDLERLQVNVEAKARRRAGKEGEKVTDRAIKVMVDQDDEVLEMEQKLLDASADVRQWGRIKNSFENRNTALKLLTTQAAAGLYVHSSTSDAKADEVRRKAGERRRQDLKDDDE